jgi:hypothetical protein
VLTTCAFCGAVFDDLNYTVSIRGVDGVFDSVRCALKAVSQQRRDERRAWMARELDASEARS